MIEFKYLLRVCFLVGFVSGVPIGVVSVFAAEAVSLVEGLALITLTPLGCGLNAVICLAIGYPVYRFLAQRNIAGMKYKGSIL